MKKYTDIIQKYTSRFGNIAGRYAAMLIFILFAGLIGFLVMTIGQLAQAEPPETAIIEKQQAIKSPTVETNSFALINTLTDRSQEITSSFDNSRCNPFADNGNQDLSSNCVYQAAKILGGILYLNQTDADQRSEALGQQFSQCQSDKPKVLIRVDRENENYETTVGLESPRTVNIWLSSNPEHRQLYLYGPDNISLETKVCN